MEYSGYVDALRRFHVQAARAARQNKVQSEHYTGEEWQLYRATDGDDVRLHHTISPFAPRAPLRDGLAQNDIVGRLAGRMAGGVIQVSGQSHELDIAAADL